MTRRIWAPAVLLAASLITALALAEGGVRLMAAVNPGLGERLHEYDPDAVQIRPAGEHGYRQRPNSILHYRNGTTATANAMGFRGPLVEQPKPAGRRRIVLLGGSTTHGWGVNDDQTIDAHLRQLLRERFPSDSVDVVNLAFDGYDAFQLLERLKADGLPLDPDLLVVNTGINDVRNAKFSDLADPDPRTLIWEAVVRRLREEERRGGPLLRTRIKKHLYLARILSLSRTLTQQRENRPGPNEALPHIDPNPQAIDRFETNLRRIARLALDSGIPVVFSTPPSSIPHRYDHDLQRRISYWLSDAEQTQAFRDSLTARMEMVVADYQAEGEPVTFARYAPPPEFFIDDCHLTSEGNRVVAEDLVPIVSEILHLGEPASAAEGHHRSPSGASGSAGR